MPTQFGTITDAERQNGWSQRTLDAYLAERDSMTGWSAPGLSVQAYVAGNVVTEFVRPRPAIRCENCRSFNPHKWGR